MSEPFTYQPPPTGPESGYSPPSLGRRLGANILDGLLVALPVMIVLTILGAGQYVSNVLLTVAITAYIVLMLSSQGATIGKKLLGIRVATSPEGRGLPTQAQALKRYWGFTLAPLVLITFNAALAMIEALVVMGWFIYILVTLFSNPINRGWYDKFAGTWVIDAKTNPQQ